MDNLELCELLETELEIDYDAQDIDLTNILDSEGNLILSSFTGRW